VTTLRRLRYTHGFVDRHGRARYYVRIPGRKQVPLRGAFGDAQFMSDYHAALEEAPRKEIGSERTRAGSVSQAIIAYYRDNSFTGLAAGTRAMRRAILEQLRQEQPPGTIPFGERPIAPLRQQHIAILLGRKKPFAARNWLKTLRGLMQFAVATGRIDTDPTQGIKPPKARPGEIHSWTDEEIAQYEATHAIGTRPRLALALLLFTAQRRGDIVRLGPQHIRNGELTVRQEKTGVTLTLPVRAELAAILAATAGDHLSFLVAANGKPFSPAGFGNIFREWCQQAGLPDRCSAHGLRKAACRMLAKSSMSNAREKQHVECSPRRDAASPKSRRSAATEHCPRCPAILAPPVKRSSPNRPARGLSRPSRRPKPEHNNGKP